MDMLKLQQQIDEALSNLKTKETIAIRLSKGSDVTDLTSIVDVDVAIGDRQRRTFSIVSQRFFDRIFNEPGQIMGIDTSFWTSGGPLIIARVITGEIVAKGVLKFIAIERGRGW